MQDAPLNQHAASDLFDQFNYENWKWKLVAIFESIISMFAAILMMIIFSSNLFANASNFIVDILMGKLWAMKMFELWKLTLFFC